MDSQTRKTVLVADDDRDVREGLKRRLNGWGYEAVLVENGEQACELLIPKTGPKVAVIDRRMPGIDGGEVCSRIRESRPATDVFLLMLTGKKQPKDVVSGLAAGANDYVSKPFDNRELRARIENGFRAVTAFEELKHTALVTHEEPKQMLARLLNENTLVPEFDARNQRFGFGSLDDALGQLQSENAVTREVLDYFKTCPKCQGLPTFRDGCPGCGSARVGSEEMLHHFRCGYVGARQEFLDESDELRCPKCMKTDIEVGVDFEHFAGPYECCDCEWSGTELEAIGQCLRCELRFPSQNSNNTEVIGYHVKRMELLAELVESE